MCIVIYVLSWTTTQLWSLRSINNVSASRFVACVNIPSGCVKLLLFSVLSLDILLFEAVDYLISLHHNSFWSLKKIISVITLGLHVLTLEFQQFQMFAVVSLAFFIISNGPYPFLSCRCFFMDASTQYLILCFHSCMSCKTSIFFSSRLRIFYSLHTVFKYRSM